MCRCEHSMVMKKQIETHGQRVKKFLLLAGQRE